MYVILVSFVIEFSNAAVYHCNRDVPWKLTTYDDRTKSMKMNVLTPRSNSSVLQKFLRVMLIETQQF